MLLFASFLGLASVGQTLVALLGGLDLSIPFVIGSSNVGLLYLIVARRALAVARDPDRGRDRRYHRDDQRAAQLPLQGQALIVTLGIGFAISGGVQIITSIGSAYSGNVFGKVPAGSRTSPR